MTCRIDHIAITAPSLEVGSDLVFQALGVRPQPGGQHPRMGTHNQLLRLGDSAYLEIIAVDPSAPLPSRPRWFELDRMSVDAPPRLACWVARSEDIQASHACAPDVFGEIVSMSRGELEWLISIPEDGSLPLGGAAPSLIQWQTSRHPAQGMADLGCTLIGLEIFHPEPDRITALLTRLDVTEPGIALSVQPASVPGLKAVINTPQGQRALGVMG